MLRTKEITKMYKGTNITSRVDLYKTTKSGSRSSQQQECREQCCSKSPLVRSCIFEFGSGSSCLNQIEDNEVFGLQNYKNSYKM